MYIFFITPKTHILFLYNIIKHCTHTLYVLKIDCHVILEN